MQQASYLEGGPLMWMLPLYMHINQKSDDDDDDDDDGTENKLMVFFFSNPTVHCTGSRILPGKQ